MLKNCPFPDDTLIKLMMFYLKCPYKSLKESFKHEHSDDFFEDFGKNILKKSKRWNPKRKEWEINRKILD